MSFPERLHLAVEAYNAERYDEALRIVLEVHEETQRGDTTLKPPEFIVQFTLEQLAERYEPARAALAAHRDAQVARLLAGDLDTEARVPGFPQTRFSIVADLNDTLGDAPGTCDLFVTLLDRMPDNAARYARHALPALIETGDFALASRFMPDPLPRLPDLNGLAEELPLFPPSGAAPRLAAELSNYMREVWQRAAILDGLGRAQEAAALRADAVAGIASEEMRELARRELDAPGTIITVISERHPGPDGQHPGP